VIGLSVDLYSGRRMNTSIVGWETHIVKCPALGYVDQGGNCLMGLRRLDYIAVEPQFEMALGSKGLGFRVESMNNPA
jgi:hypothetical protein